MYNISMHSGSALQHGYSWLPLARSACLVDVYKEIHEQKHPQGRLRQHSHFFLISQNLWARQSRESIANYIKVQSTLKN